jgi:hypothetical protein
LQVELETLLMRLNHNLKSGWREVALDQYVNSFSRSLDGIRESLPRVLVARAADAVVDAEIIAPAARYSAPAV